MIVTLASYSNIVYVVHKSRLFLVFLCVHLCPAPLHLKITRSNYLDIKINMLSESYHGIRVTYGTHRWTILSEFSIQTRLLLSLSESLRNTIAHFENSEQNSESQQY